jgi:hypothetical protein
MAEIVMIMEIFVAQSQREDSLPDQLFHRMLDAPGITIVVKAESQALQKTNLLLHFTQQERPAIARDRTGIKAGQDLTTERRGKGKRILDTLCHGRGRLLSGANQFYANPLCHRERPFPTPPL